MTAFRRHGDPEEMARTSKLVKAWQRRTAEKAAGDPLYDEHWYAYLLTIKRPVPPPVCSWCDDSGIVTYECTINNRCTDRLCERPDRRSDPDVRHTYVRACTCPASLPFQRSFAHAFDEEGSSRPQKRAPKVNFSQVGR